MWQVRRTIRSVTVRPFISYAKEDRDMALRLYNDLRVKGARPWIDEHDISGGQKWKPAITRAISESSHFVALLSTCSVNKQGFVQKELRQAIDLLDTFPPDEVFVIPVRLDNSEPRHERLAELQWIDLFPKYGEGFGRLLRSLRLEPTVSEPTEYQRHVSVAPTVRGKVVVTSEKDDEGFLTSDAVAELVLGRVQGRQRLRITPMLIFENSHQHTWLVITERIVACVLDDTEKEASYDPLRWGCRHRFALPVEVEPYKKNVGLLHLGPEHQDWLYSTRLHPDPALLKAQVAALLDA